VAKNLNILQLLGINAIYCLIYTTNSKYTLDTEISINFCFYCFILCRSNRNYILL